MVEFGALAYSLTLGTGVLGVVAGVLHFYRPKPVLEILAQYTIYAHVLLVSLATVTLLILLGSADMSVTYVANHVNHALPMFYRLTSIWAGQAGSLLWWNFLLILFSAIAIWDMSRREPVLVPGMAIVLLGTSLFFSALGNLTADSDPFQVLYLKTGEIAQAVAQPDGRGLNPLLQHWAMVIHPPILYLGYVSFAIPFAIAMAALMRARLNLNWTKLIRRWTLFSWAFLGTGILLGGKWAYEELGWGGYWAWDPVENASLMPWLTGTAFLHSIIVQEKRGMLKVWNMSLVSISFLMCIFGTFLTRSGVVSSVHAFADSDLGPFFVVFMGVITVFSMVLILKNMAILKSDRPIHSFLSREAGFLFNNVILLIALFTVIWGTMYPVFSEAVYGEKVSVTAVWFNKWMAPLGLLILFLTGLGPLLAWRETSWKSLSRNLRWPITALLLTFTLYVLARGILLGIGWNNESMKYVAGLSFGLSAFVITGVLEEFIRATKARVSYTKENIAIGFIRTLFQNKRRYLGYSVHLGLAILFIGFTGKMFTSETRLLLAKGEAERFKDYTIEVANFQQLMVRGAASAETNETQRPPLYYTSKATIHLYKNNRYAGEDTTEIRMYPMYNPATGKYDNKQQTSEPFILSFLDEDVYIQFAGIDEDGRSLTFQVWINPLVKWVWIGFGFFVAFSMLLLLPVGEKRKS